MSGAKVVVQFIDYKEFIGSQKMRVVPKNGPGFKKLFYIIKNVKEENKTLDIKKLAISQLGQFNPHYGVIISLSPEFESKFDLKFESKLLGLKSEGLEGQDPTNRRTRTIKRGIRNKIKEKIKNSGSETYCELGDNLLFIQENPKNGTVLYGDDSNNLFFGRNTPEEFYGLGGHDRLYGNNGDDTLNGGIGSDILFGSNGNDMLNGAEGDDVLVGGNDNDILNGGSGYDVYILEGSWGKDTIKDLDGGMLIFDTASSPKTFTVTKEGNDLVVSKGKQNPFSNAKILDFFQNKKDFFFADRIGRSYDLIATDGQYKLVLASK